jgi:hypothetical protein
MRRIFAATAFIAIWSALTLLAVLFGFHYDWPDFVHTDYGLPLTWATHTESTFVGPVDTWTVNINNLALDLGIWLVIMIVIVFAIQIIVSRENHPSEAVG